jgi:TAG lipase/steryl ester hydrolase/phospholipase A2/LPA acyltransferase
MKALKRECAVTMLHATDYPTWYQAAAELDRIEGREDWKNEDASDDYDWRLIRSRLRQIRMLRADGAMTKLAYHLRQGLHWNLGNIGNPKLYLQTQVGTKYLIRDYVDEVASALNLVCDTDIEGMDLQEKLKFFHDTTQSFGRSALMLSGGATLGLFHVGVVKALFRNGVLPDVVSGSSAGSVVAATIGTRDQDDIESLLDPHESYYHFWKPMPVGKMIERRAIMDQSQLRRAVSKNIRDLTFEQAYRKSGLIINITVSAAGSNQPPRLLNYLTSPYLYIREAVLASCAVPLLFQPVMLMTRDDGGQRIPYMPLLRWTDGSLESDLPMLRLRRLHNVNHFIVSQTNPHVLPFLSPKATPSGQGFLGSIRDYGYSIARSQARELINFGRASMPGPVSRALNTASSILDQDYSGHVTILPEVSLWRYARVTANPDMESVQRFILEGERATWPRMAMIRNQTLIAKTLSNCVHRLELRMAGGEDRRKSQRPPSISSLRLARDQARRDVASGGAS